jgi:ABC-type glycerol-3-phosphate transport system permease component
MKATGLERYFVTFNHFFLFVVSLTMLLPLVHVLAVSFSSPQAVDANLVSLLPMQFTTASWEHILSKADLWKSLLVNIYITVIGTAISMFFTCLMAYPLTRKDFRIRKAIMFGVVFAIIFHAPMIPFFLTVKAMGLMNSLWALMLPYMISGFNMIIVRSFFMQLPYEIEESAKVDGCSDYGILFRMVIPLSKPVLATISLFYGVFYWNTFTAALFFIQDTSLYPLQMKLREFITEPENMVLLFADGFNQNTLKSSTIIFATIPILLVYPFIQKYFVQGATLGSVKE